MHEWGKKGFKIQIDPMLGGGGNFNLACVAMKLSPLRKIGLADNVLFFIKWDYLVSYFLVV